MINIRSGGKQNNIRKHKGRSWSAHKNESRIRDAQESQTAWRALTPREQIRELDRRLGVGVGAKKQRARIQRQMSRTA